MKRIWSDQVLTFLQSHPLFATYCFSQEDIVTLLERYAVEDVFISKSKVLHDSHDWQDGFYLLLRGKLFSNGQLLEFDSSQVESTSFAKGQARFKEGKLRAIYPGGLVGLATLMAETSPCWQQVILAQNLTELLYFPKDVLQQRFLKADDWDVLERRFWHQILVLQANEVKEMQRHLYFLQLKNIRTKLAAFLLQRAEICQANHFTLPYSREDLANYLNVARPSMSRELALLKEEGCIDFHLRSFVILDYQALRSYIY